MAKSENSFYKLALHPIKFRLFLLQKLPAAFFSGVKVKEIDEEKVVVSVPYKWFSTNPFRSTYFACLSMAAEMSTGLLVLAETNQSKIPISTLVLKMEASFHKKATGISYFTCSGGETIRSAINIAMAHPEGTTIDLQSTGKNAAGELIATFNITWTIRKKSLKS